MSRRLLVLDHGSTPHNLPWAIGIEIAIPVAFMVWQSRVARAALIEPSL